MGHHGRWGRLWILGSCGVVCQWAAFDVVWACWLRVSVHPREGASGGGREGREHWGKCAVTQWGPHVMLSYSLARCESSCLCNIFVDSFGAY